MIESNDARTVTCGYCGDVLEEGDITETCNKCGVAICFLCALETDGEKTYCPECLDEKADE